MSLRWPGIDGGVLLVAGGGLCLLQAVRQVEAMYLPVAIVCATIGLYLYATRLLRSHALGGRSWRGSHRGFRAGYLAYFWVLKRLGRRPVQWALVPLVGFYWLFLGAQQPGLDAYLRRRFPEADPILRARYRFRILLNFAWSLVDRVHAMISGGSDLELDHSAVTDIKEVVHAEESPSREGFLMLSGHIGNPDLAGVLLGEQARRINILLYRGPNDPFFDVLEEAMGERAPHFIAVNDGVQMASLEAVKAMQRGEVVAAKGDRVVDERFAVVPFMGGMIRVPTGPFLLAAMAKTPVLFTGCFKTGPSTYRFEVSGPHRFEFTSRKTRDADLARWAAQWAEVMESWVVDYPLQWYNFFDLWDHPDGSPSHDPLTLRVHPDSTASTPPGPGPR